MERPKRATRKEVNYRESARVVNVDEEQETVNTTEQGAAKRSLSRDNSWGDSRERGRLRVFWVVQHQKVLKHQSSGHLEG